MSDNFFDTFGDDSTKVDRSNLQWADALQVDVAMLTVTLVKGDIQLCVPMHTLLKGMSSASKHMYAKVLNNDNNSSTDTES